MALRSWNTTSLSLIVHALRLDNSEITGCKVQAENKVVERLAKGCFSGITEKDFRMVPSFFPPGITRHLCKLRRDLEAVIKKTRRGKEHTMITGTASDIGDLVGTALESLDQEGILSLPSFSYYFGTIGRLQRPLYGLVFGLL